MMTKHPVKLLVAAIGLTLGVQIFSMPITSDSPLSWFVLPSPANTDSLFLPLIMKSGARSTIDQPDEVVGYQIHVLYVLPSDGIDRNLDTMGTLTLSVAAFQQWFTGQTGGPTLRFDTYQGTLDVTFYRLSRSNTEIASYDAFVRDQLQVELNTAGFNQPNKLYAVYYDGLSTFACGGGAWPPTLIGNVAAMYLQGAYGTVQCNQNPFATSPSAPGYMEFAMLHEILHTLGFAASCASHHTLSGHVSDNNTDLLYAGPMAWVPSVLDVGQDDYYAHAIPNCLDLAKSVFLEPLPSDAVKPPGWP